jgi:hypothetical protein
MKIGLTYDLKTTYLQQGFSHEEVAEFDSLKKPLPVLNQP